MDMTGSLQGPQLPAKAGRRRCMPTSQQPDRLARIPVRAVEQRAKRVQVEQALYRNAGRRRCPIPPIASPCNWPEFRGDTAPAWVVPCTNGWKVHAPVQPPR